MQPTNLQVVLRPRASWEAMELGTALVRQHAGVIWRAWLLASLPVLLLVNLLAWRLEAAWLGMLLMWWLKPWFDRIVLFVLSRAVFGQTVTVGQAVAALWRFGRTGLLRDLTWARLSPMRSATMPVTILEGARGAALRQRRRLVPGPDMGQAMGLTFVCLHFEAILYLAAITSVFAMIPAELFSESARALWTLWVDENPVWLQLCSNALLWVITSLIEPFYVGAGFGVYLNRRTRLEGWDIEMALRRIQQRLTRVTSIASSLCLAALLCLPWGGANAQAQPEPPVSQSAQTQEQTLEQTYEDTRPFIEVPLDEVLPPAADEQRFMQSVNTAKQDPLLNATKEVSYWRAKHRKQQQLASRSNRSLPTEVIAGLARVMLWLLIALLVGFVLWRSRHWLASWFESDNKPAATPEVTRAPAEHVQVIPEDVIDAVRTLWTQGRQRAALALLYRASVEVMVGRSGASLPPGATEAQVLRAARKLPDSADRTTFANVVRQWQYAAYAQRMPANEQFERLLDEAKLRFWTVHP